MYSQVGMAAGVAHPQRKTQKRSRLQTDSFQHWSVSEIRAPNFHVPTHLKDQISRSPRSFMATPFRLPLRQVAIEIVKYELAETLTP